jgi:hypothetical protein
MPEPLQVTAAEAGQKLLQYLSRRNEEPLSVPAPLDPSRAGPAQRRAGPTVRPGGTERYIPGTALCRGRNECGTRPRVAWRLGIAPHRCGDG